MKGTGYWNSGQWGQRLSVVSCQRLGIVRMHVAFGRVRRKSRIVADSTDYADGWWWSGVREVV